MGDFNKLNMNDIVISFNLVDMVAKPTRGCSCLDEIYLERHCASVYCNCHIFPPVGISDHDVVWLQHHFTKPSIPVMVSKQKKVVYDYRASHIAAFSKVAFMVNFDSISNYSNVDDMVKMLYELLNPLLLIIPKKVVVCKLNDKPWINPVIKTIINQHWAAYKKNNYMLYCHFKSKLRLEIAKAKIKWVNKMNIKNGKSSNNNSI